ncbi:MAG: iron ABC transporter permease [Mesorhizobium sp.]|nr:MAG: iron ABC transporter permease [Mesorhizobium sp.]
MTTSHEGRRGRRGSRRQPLWPLYLILFMLLLSAVVLAFATGRYSVPPLMTLRILLHPIIGGEADWTATVETVVWEIRLPRIAGALLVGASLAAAGATYQCIFRNPLISPAILGASQGAAFGASLALLLRLSWSGVMGMAMASGILATSATALIGRHLGSGSMITLVLAGLVVAAVFNGLVAVVQYIADPLDVLPSITFWLMGSLNRIGNDDLGIIGVPMALMFAQLYAFRWHINVLGADNDAARALGVNAPLVSGVAIAGATVLTALAVSVSGIVGWVGLIVPHIARFLVGPNFNRLLPISALTGGLFLLAMDTLARSMATQELPLGVVTSLVGAPFFAIVLGRARRQWF